MDTSFYGIPSPKAVMYLSIRGSTAHRWDWRRLLPPVRIFEVGGRLWPPTSPLFFAPLKDFPDGERDIRRQNL
jgi:hypothetical protein